MNVSDWELRQYEGPALQVCMRLREDPFKTVDTPSGPLPNWMVYAAQMHECRVMLEELRNGGMLL